jgi:hypothetical protein
VGQVAITRKKRGQLQGLPGVARTMPRTPSSPFRPWSAPRPEGVVGFAWGALVVGVVCVLVVTLRPGTALDLLEDPGQCILCGDAGLANLLRNVLLFVPLGVAGGMVTGGVALPVAGAALLSGGIEVVQLLVPGRNALFVDLAANTAGGALGAIAGSWLLGLFHGVRHPGDAWWSDARAWGVAAAAVLLLTGWLLEPAPPPPPYYAIHTARHAHLEAYHGRVLDARVDGVPLPGGAVGDPERVRRVLEGGAPVELLFEAGPAPGSLAPILSVHTGDEDEVLLVGASGNDLVLRLPYRAQAARLARPHVRIPGALDGVLPGDTVALAVEAVRGEVVLVVDGWVFREARPRVDHGWALLYFPRELGAAGRSALSFLWLLILAFPAGFLARDLRPAGGIALGLLLVGGMVHALPFLLPAPLPGSFVALPLGALTGAILSRRARGGTQPAPSRDGPRGGTSRGGGK